MMNDLIADAITRIRNASMRKLDTATLVHSKTIVAIVEVLKAKEYLEDFNIEDLGNNKKSIKVTLKYDDNEQTVINEVKRLSKPGRRVYKNASELKTFKNGYGTIIVSTSKGVLANDKAFELGIGGEVMCTVW